MEQNSCACTIAHAGCVASLALAMAVSSNHLAAAPASDWKPTKWHGEKAWESTSQGWTATVSEERCRLVAITRGGDGSNLLHESSKDSISWGGHRCWLGPQSEWKPDWPPPVDWETSFAARIEAAGSLLSVSHPHTDGQYPALSRTYQWREGILHCRLNWQGGRHYSIHILQLPRWAIVHVRTAPAEGIPLGYYLQPIYGRPTTRNDVPLSGGVSSVDGDAVTLWHSNVSEKVAFAPQEITAEIGDCRLKMRRGEQTGFSNSSPFLGLLTHVYLGDWENPFIEIEQVSPYADGGAASSEILLEPFRPGHR